MRLDACIQWRQQDRPVVQRVAQEAMGVEAAVVRAEAEEVTVEGVISVVVIVGKAVRMQVGSGKADRNAEVTGVSHPRRGPSPPPEEGEREGATEGVAAAEGAAEAVGRTQATCRDMNRTSRRRISNG